MSTPEQELAKRIRELRRRHFGARGKNEFARRLGVTREQYDQFESNRLPPGELMVRMCEITGEDLQWLLTGASSRGTVVISGARRRHQDLLTRIASSLDADPKLAGPLEAFFDLLVKSGKLRPDAALPAPTVAADTDAEGPLLPVFEKHEWPDRLPDPDDPGEHALALFDVSHITPPICVPALLSEPALDDGDAAEHSIQMITLADRAERPHRFVECRNFARCAPASFGVVMADDSMSPMFDAGDVLIVSVGAEPLLGKPALCRFTRQEDNRCRIWLGRDENTIQLARASDGESEQAPSAELLWALEVLYRVAPAA